MIQPKRNAARCGRCGVIFSYTVSTRNVLYRCHDCNTPNMIPGMPMADAEPVPQRPPTRVAIEESPEIVPAPPHIKPDYDPLVAASAPSSMSLARMASISKNRITVMPAADDDKFQANLEKALKASMEATPEVSTDSTVDEDIRLAIELSLLTAGEKTQATDDFELDDNLKQVMEESLREAQDQAQRQELEAKAEEELIRQAIAMSLMNAQTKLTARQPKSPQPCAGSHISAGHIEMLNRQLDRMVSMNVDEVEWDDLEVDSVVYTARTMDPRRTLRLIREKSMSK